MISFCGPWADRYGLELTYFQIRRDTLLFVVYLQKSTKFMLNQKNYMSYTTMAGLPPDL